MGLKEHAEQSAELCRLLYPDLPWMHVAGLLHGLGKLLAHKKFGSQPQWAVCGDSYPLGCRFDPHIFGAQFFLANPDKRRRMYQTQLGIYQARCGLRNVLMSWGSQEYLFLVLLLNSSQLPYEALFLLRHLRFTALTRPGNTYQALLSPEDEALMPLLRAFQRLTAYQRVDIPAALRLNGPDFHAYYTRLLHQYLPEQLMW
ncbi:hypothetical protein V8C86DRAFT_2522884 [Haematococcus lacustris]